VTRRAGRVGRVVSAVAVVGVLAGVTVAGSTLERGAVVEAGLSAVVVPATATTLVCPGPVALPDDGGVSDDAFDPRPVDAQSTLRVATATRAADGADDPDDPDGTDGGAAPLSLGSLAGAAPLLELPGGGGAQAGALSTPAGPTVLRAEPVDDVAPVTGGASASVVTQGDLRGLSAGSCQAPSADIWLVGGSTEIGSSALLVVTNPGRTPAEVSLDLWGPSGPLEGTGASLLVAPGAERALLLEGVAAEQRRVVVHATAAGGLVTAHLQDSRLNGFTPAGVDLVTAGAAPASRQVIGGLLVPASEAGAEDTALVRMLAPGAEPARAALTLLGPDGPVTLPGAERVDLGPGEVTDVSLAGLPAGSYTAVVESDTAVVAGAMLTRQGPPLELDDIPTLDRAWAAAGSGAGDALVALPPGVGATLLLGSVAPPGASADGDGGRATGVLRAIGADGRVLVEEPVSVPAGTTLPVVVGPGGVGGEAEVAAVQVVPDDDVSERGPALAAWVVVTAAVADQGLVSVLTPVPGAQPQPTVTVGEGSRIGLP